MPDYIHNDPEFVALLRIVAAHHQMAVGLVEKDYWLVHTLYSMKKQGLAFELKGGTSLSKGFGLIHRFSEDLDIHISSSFGLIIEGNEDNPKIRQARRDFYDMLTKELCVDGIMEIKRDHAFDDLRKYRSGGIRLFYPNAVSPVEGLKEGILLEVGFDVVTPNMPKIIKSWVWEYLEERNMHTKYIDNTAFNIACYHPGYTLVEKIQTIIRKYRSFGNGQATNNFMRQYYDVYCLLANIDVLDFLGTQAYAAHKALRIRGEDASIPVSVHPAFLLEDEAKLQVFTKMYQSSAGLYFRGQPDFLEVLERIRQCLPRL